MTDVLYPDDIECRCGHRREAHFREGCALCSCVVRVTSAERPDVRSLAVEIVDCIHGYTMEFSNQPNVHRAEYDWVERRLTRHLSDPQ